MRTRDIYKKTRDNDKSQEQREDKKVDKLNLNRMYHCRIEEKDAHLQ